MSEEDPDEFDLSVDDADPSGDADTDGAGSDAPDEGDPFADLDTGDGGEDPFADLDTDDGAEDPFADIDGVDIEDDPFSDFDVDAGTAEEEGLFTEMEVSELDDEVWSELDDGDGTGEPTEQAAVDTGPEVVDGAADAVGEERVVEKRSYCEQCEYFSEPPDVSCTYPDSAIVELVDTERFRVRNCPIVERRENSDISTIAGSSGDEPELEPGDPTAAADSGSDD